MYRDVITTLLCFYINFIPRDFTASITKATINGMRNLDFGAIMHTNSKVLLKLV